MATGCPKRAAAQVPVTLNQYQRQQFFDAIGKPLAGGKVCTYQAGTTTPLATYTDSTGNFQNTNPLILDSGGFGTMWLTANAYKFLLLTAGSDNTCSTGVQQWVLDFVTPAPFLGGNNAWTGNETHAGTEVYSLAVTLNGGGAFNGVITGSPTFSGNPGFTGTPTFSNLENFPLGISTDIINGTLTNSGSIAITGANGTGANTGENVISTAGNGGATGPGGVVNLVGGTGGATSGNGGGVGLFGGAALAGNGVGGTIAFLSGNGVGAGQGGDFTWQGGTGGGTAARGGQIVFTGGTGGAGGNGGDITLNPGPLGAGGQNGSLLVGRGRMIYTSFDSPICASTGIGGAGTCAVDPQGTDSDGYVILTPAAGVAATGIVTLTFKKAMGAHGATCTETINATGTGVWNARATVFTSGQASATANFQWDDNAVALTAASTYNISYHCVGRV